MTNAPRASRTVRSAIAVLMVLALGTACGDSDEDSLQNADVTATNGDDQAEGPTATDGGSTDDDSSAGIPKIISNVDPVEAGVGEVQLGGTTYHFEDLGDPAVRVKCGPNINEEGILEVYLPSVPGGSDSWDYVSATLVHEELVFTDDLEFQIDGNYWSLTVDRLTQWSVSEDRLHATGAATVSARDDGDTEEITFSFTCPSP